MTGWLSCRKPIARSGWLHRKQHHKFIPAPPYSNMSQKPLRLNSFSKISWSCMRNRPLAKLAHFLEITIIIWHICSTRLRTWKCGRDQGQECTILTLKDVPAVFQRRDGRVPRAECRGGACLKSQKHQMDPNARMTRFHGEKCAVVQTVLATSLAGEMQLHQFLGTSFCAAWITQNSNYLLWPLRAVWSVAIIFQGVEQRVFLISQVSESVSKSTRRTGGIFRRIIFEMWATGLHRFYFWKPNF